MNYLDPTTMRRLGFIKYVFRKAEEQSFEPEPLSGVALLTFHDAIELFLHLASERLNAGRSGMSFMEYWEVLGDKIDGEVAEKETMRRLNKARVNLKHHGTLPSTLDMEAFRRNASGFFEKNTPRIFDITFDEISLTVFVEPEEARNDLEKSLDLVSRNQLDDALTHIALAFEKIVHHAEENLSDAIGHSPFKPRVTLPGFRDIGYGIEGDTASLTRFAEKASEALQEIHDSLRLISLGIDYHRYKRFKLATPSVTRTLSGEYHVTHFATARSPDQSPELVQFCIDFVIDTYFSLARQTSIGRLFRKSVS